MALDRTNRSGQANDSRRDNSNNNRSSSTDMLDITVGDEDSKINLHAYDPTEDGFYHIFGDGSWTAPEKWWASLGGYGLWIPQQPVCEKIHTIAGGAVGQDGSSTRQELTGWIAALTLPFRICYATDSAALIAKAKKTPAGRPPFREPPTTHHQCHLLEPLRQKMESAN